MKSPTLDMVVGRPKIVEGRVAKIAKERALLEQPFIKDTGKTVDEHIKESVAAIGENIQACPDFKSSHAMYR